MDLKRYKKRANKKKLECNINTIWLISELTNGRCVKTGLKFVLEPNDVTLNPYLPSVDRIDSTKGYTKDNCQLVIFGFNTLKSNNTEKEVLEFCKGFVERYERDNK